MSLRRILSGRLGSLRPAAPPTGDFEYEGFAIPRALINLTGGGAETWHEIASGHMRQYEQYCPIEPDHQVLEIGCGVGRDAIPIASILGPDGSYIGIDIIGPSIDWCHANIARRYPNFVFVHLDIQSDLHNPRGHLSVRDLALPVDAASRDLIILQSVFTHMFEPDIVHYLKEFRRVLRPGGQVFASFFYLDNESLSLAETTGQPLRFPHPHGDGCFINHQPCPEGAVGYTPEALDRMIRQGSFELDQPIHRGHWSGRRGTTDGQDIVILRPR